MLLVRLMLFSILIGTPGPATAESRSAWEMLLQTDHEATREASAIERDVLKLLSLEQIEAYLDGVPAEQIVLTTGETLASFIDAHGIGGIFDVSWFSIDGGGVVSYGEDFELRSTIGQADAGVMSGGELTLTGGFLVVRQAFTGATCDAMSAVFCDGFESGDLSLWSGSTGI